MRDTAERTPRWLLALESSTSQGGAALVADGAAIASIRLDEGLRHGRELMPAAAALLEKQGLRATDLHAVAVSAGPGSYTGTRVGVMAAKALAYAASCRLAAVSSLAALAASARGHSSVASGDVILVMQDARRDEVYVGLYRLVDDGVECLAPDAAVTPEEARARVSSLVAQGGRPVLAGTGFSTYGEMFQEFSTLPTAPGVVNPEAVALLGWRQIVLDNYADPFVLQPCYLRRDAGADWTHDHLIAAIK